MGKIPPIIGIHGKARSGKDTAANFIVHGVPGTYQYSLASPLKKMLNAGFDIDMYSEYWENRKEEVIPAIGRSPRYLLQTLGTEWGRQLVDEDIWVKLADYIRRNTGLERPMVISDLRFENEADWIRKNNGVIIHVERAGIEDVNPHASEVGIEKHETDVVIKNDGSLEEFQQKILELFDGEKTGNFLHSVD